MFDIQNNSTEYREQVLRMSKKIRHRGPDWSGIFCGERAIISHERLSIVDPQSGRQPLYSSDGKIVLAVNGEIYNHREIRRELEGEYEFQTGSDCEVIIPLWQRMGLGMLEKISGIFAFALYDIEHDEYLIARDPIGVIPLYIGWDRAGHFYAASELKALEGICVTIKPFLPGHYWSSRDGEMKRWYHRDWESYDAVKDNPTDIGALRSSLEDAVRRQLMSDVPYGVLLSGGLDSSIISAVAKKYADKQFAANVLQIASDTAAAIMRSYAQLGPILGPIYAAIVAAQGAIQIAAAKQQRNEAMGLKAGGFSEEYVKGYTRRGNPEETAGVIPVHKNEFVANHEAVANPAVRQFLDVFDVAQKRGTIRMLNTTQILEQVRTRQGRYSGGYSNEETAGPSRPSASPLAGMTAEQRSQVVALLQENNRLLGILTEKELVVDPRKVRDGIRRVERLERNVSR